VSSGGRGVSSGGQLLPRTHRKARLHKHQEARLLGTWEPILDPHRELEVAKWVHHVEAEADL